METSFALGDGLGILFNEILVAGLGRSSLSLNLRNGKVVLESDVVEILGRVARPESDDELPKVRTLRNVKLEIFAVHDSLNFNI